MLLLLGLCSDYLVRLGHRWHRLSDLFGDSYVTFREYHSRIFCLRDIAQEEDYQLRIVPGNKYRHNVLQGMVMIIFKD